MRPPRGPAARLRPARSGALLLAWFRRNRRDLPWRRPAGPRPKARAGGGEPKRDPYRVWVSEIMLQQTTVKAVVPYFERFMTAFPTLEALAQARSSRVLASWSGLGYYRRARHLHEAARLVVRRHDGRLPRSRDALLALPGIGRYTAGAILSIAWGDREPLVDGNVARVLCRLLGERRDPAGKPVADRLWRVAGALVAAATSPGDLNEALMELGATVCTPVSPLCSACPLSRDCRARALGIQERIPPARKRREGVRLRRRIAIVERNGRVLLRRRGKTGLMDGLWELPELGGNGAAPRFEGVERIGMVRHLVTYRTIDVAVHRARLEEPPPPGWRFVSPSGLKRLPVSSLVGKALDLRAKAPAPRK